MPKVSSSPTCHPSLLPIWACPCQAWRVSRGASCYLPGVQEVWAGSIWLPAPFAPTQHTTCLAGPALVASVTAGRQGLCSYTYCVLSNIPVSLSASLSAFSFSRCVASFFLLSLEWCHRRPLFTCFSSCVSVPRSFCLCFTNSFSLGVLASLFLLGHPQEQGSSNHTWRNCQCVRVSI